MKIAQIIFLTATFVCQVIAQTDVDAGLHGIQRDDAGEERVNQITDDAGKFFQEGLLGLADNRRSDAKERFDRAVEVFLTSGVSVRSNGKLQACYMQLIETVYRLEFPSLQQQPQIKPLAQTCGWNIDNGLADQAAKLSLANESQSTKIYSSSTIETVAGNQPVAPQNGFSEQRFEPSPLDELSKIELTPEEQNVVYTTEGKRKNIVTPPRYSSANLNLELCPMPALQKIMPGDLLARTEQTIGKKLNLSRDKSASGQVGLMTANLVLPGTKIVRVRVFKNQIYDVAVIYENNFNWKNLVEFATTASKNLQLQNKWIFNYISATYSCKNFEMKAYTVNNYYALTVADSDVSVKIGSDLYARYLEQAKQAEKARIEAERIKREKELEEQRKKATFKP